MATYQDLLPQILPEVPGCPQTIVLQKLSDTVRHFCRESWYWQPNIEPVTLLPFQPMAPELAVYELKVTEPVDVLGIIDLYYKGRPLPSGVESALNRFCSDWQSETAPHPRMYIPVGTHKVRLVPASDSVQAIAVTGKVAVAPAIGATEFGDALLTYTDGLVAGSLARLQRMAKKEWSDPNAATMNQALYADSLSLAKLEALREHHADAPTVHPLLNL